jgi:hypothetical protein
MRILLLGLFVVVLVLVLLVLLLSSSKKEYLSIGPMKRNMSLDLRCEPSIPQHKYNTGPFGISSIVHSPRMKCFGQEELRDRFIINH